MACSLAYCQYDWVDGETYTTDTIELPPTTATVSPITATAITSATDSSGVGSSIEFDYSFTHHIDHMTHAMIAKVGTPLRVTLHVSPATREPTAAITSDSTAVRAKFESLMMLSNTPPTSPMASSRSLSRLSNHTKSDSIDFTTGSSSMRDSMNGGMQRSPTSRQSVGTTSATDAAATASAASLRTSVAQHASELRPSTTAGVAANTTSTAAATDSDGILCGKCGTRCTQCAAELQQLRRENAELKQILQLVAATDMTACSHESSIVRARLAAAIALDHQSNTATAAPL
jgi:hypothetical protein